MFISEQNISARSMVSFFKCTNCIGGRVSSEPLHSAEPGYGKQGSPASGLAMLKTVQII